ncbi:MAG: hypothetical protein MUE91_13195 [Ignavibacteriaceae bacterium]|nr:hypothetical protein [Ignavibacteriaceae bacterium]
MKKYISAILINALLLQFVGCYSQKEITYDEFYSLPKSEEITVETKSGETISLNEDSLHHDYVRWEKNENSITLYPQHLEKYSPTALIEKTDTVRYSKEDLSKIYVDEYDESKTITAIVVPVAIVALILIIAVISYGGPNVDW